MVGRARPSRSRRRFAQQSPSGSGPRSRFFAGMTATMMLVPLLAIGLLAGAAAASNAGAISSFTGTGISGPYGITPGPSGTLWFTNVGNSSIGEVTTTGKVSNFTGTGISAPIGIVEGPDGNLWFTNLGNNSIGMITPEGAVSNFTGTGISAPMGITVGSDGALWFTNSGNGSIGRITTSGVVSNYTGSGIVDPYAITAGPNGALWFTNQSTAGASSIGEITTSGTVSTFTSRSITFPYGITSGPDGALWFTNWPADNKGKNSIERITTAGVVTNTYTAKSIDEPVSIVTGPDKALWFLNSSTIGRITPKGAITDYSSSTISGPEWIAVGSDGALWFTNDAGFTGTTIGRITTNVTPGITGFSPKEGDVGTTVKITGFNLTGVSAVAINGTRCKITEHTATSIQMVVKTGATTGPITVTTPDGVATSRGNFKIT